MREEQWAQFIKGLTADFERQIGPSPEDTENEDRPHNPEMDEAFIQGNRKLGVFFRVVLDTPEEPLERHQFMIIKDGSMPIILPWTYGEEWYSRNKKWVSKRCRLKHLKNCMLVVIKRQTGKTEVLARTAAGVLIALNNFEELGKKDNPKPVVYCVRSFKGEHARTVLERTYHYATASAYAKCFDIRKFGKKIVLTSTNILNDVRIFRLLEGSITGETKPKLFGDEYSKWTEDAAMQQLKPMLQVDGSYALLYCTLRDNEHWFQGCLDPKQQLFYLINYAEVCNECLRTKKSEEALKCTHTKRIQAHWIDEEKRDAIKSVMPMHEIMKELYNVLPSNPGLIWEKDFLQQNLFNTFYDTTKHFSEFFMFVDPSMTSSDGSWSGTTILAENSRGESVVCYLNTDMTDTLTLIQNFVVRDLEQFVDKFPGFKEGYSVIYLFMEFNTVSHGVEVFNKIQDSYRLSECVSVVKGIKYNKEKKEFGRFGVAKKKGDEERFASLLNRKMVGMDIRFHKHCFTRNTIGIEEMKDLLLKQCSQVRNIPNIRGGVKVVSNLSLSGKPVKNDLYMSLVSALYNTKRSKNPDDTFYLQYSRRTTVSEAPPIFY
jgi:hypothetical protein